MPCSCRSPAMPCRFNSHILCSVPDFFRQHRVLRERPRGSRKYPNCQSYSLTDWYASDKNLRGIPRGSRKKMNAGRSPTCRRWTAYDNSHTPCPCRAVLWPGEVAFRTAWSWHGMCESNTVALCKSNGKDNLNP
jgi:hypothetical protein